MKYILLALVVILVVFVIYIYNGLIRQSNMVKNQKSQIDIQLQRRFDLIPSLVETVKGYAKHEQDTLIAVLEARSNYVSAKDDTEKALAADGALSSALSRLFVIVEDYPDLLANKNFLNLQKELSDTENKIAFSRQFYNDSVFKLNTKIDVFPANLIASIFRFEKEKYFESADDLSRKNPVNL